MPQGKRTAKTASGHCINADARSRHPKDLHLQLGGCGRCRAGSPNRERMEAGRMTLAKTNLTRLPAGLLLGAALLIAGCGNPEERGWNIPNNPQEKAAYDFAHSLKLPDSVPKPVPFNFALARIKALWPLNPSVSDQYFEHLCKTEASEYIVKTVENVEGVYQMRPRPKSDDTDLDFDRYALEEPTGIGWSGDDDNYNNYHSAEYFIQPLAGVYQFLEPPKRGDAGRVLRLVRGRNDDPPTGKRNG